MNTASLQNLGPTNVGSWPKMLLVCAAKVNLVILFFYSTKRAWKNIKKHTTNVHNGAGGYEFYSEFMCC